MRGRSGENKLAVPQLDGDVLVKTTCRFWGTSLWETVSLICLSEKES